MTPPPPDKPEPERLVALSVAQLYRASWMELVAADPPPLPPTRPPVTAGAESARAAARGALRGGEQRAGVSLLVGYAPHEVMGFAFEPAAGLGIGWQIGAARLELIPRAGALLGAPEGRVADDRPVALRGLSGSLDLRLRWGAAPSALTAEP